MAEVLTLRWQRRPQPVLAWRYVDANDRASVPEFLVKAINRGYAYFGSRGIVIYGSGHPARLGDWVVLDTVTDTLMPFSHEAFTHLYEPAPIGMSDVEVVNTCEQQSSLCSGLGNNGDSGGLSRNSISSDLTIGQQIGATKGPASI